MPEQYEQYDLYGNARNPNTTPESTQISKQKRNWENAFQRWSDDIGFNDGTTPYGKCGYGSMCDYCSDNDYGRPCIRALNEMCREKNITIDYSNRNFEDIWNGAFDNGKENQQ